MNIKPTAIDTYLARATTININIKLTRLQQLADDHFGHDPHAIHWGHVGDLGRVDQGLAPPAHVGGALGGHLGRLAHHWCRRWPGGPGNAWRTAEPVHRFSEPGSRLQLLHQCNVVPNTVLKKIASHPVPVILARHPVSLVTVQAHRQVPTFLDYGVTVRFKVSSRVYLAGLDAI